MRSARNGFYSFSLVHSRAQCPARPCRWVAGERDGRFISFSPSSLPFSAQFLLFSAAPSPRSDFQLPAAPSSARETRDQLELEFPAAMARGKCFLLSPSVSQLVWWCWKRCFRFQFAVLYLYVDIWWWDDDYMLIMWWFSTQKHACSVCVCVSERISWFAWWNQQE